MASLNDNDVVSTSYRGQLEMSLWKDIVEQVKDSSPSTTLGVIFHGRANLIAGYRLYYLLSYAKRRGLEQVVLRTDGGFWIAEATDWLIDSKVDKIVIAVNQGDDDPTSLPILDRIAELQAAKKARAVELPLVELELASGNAETLDLSESHPDLTVRARRPPQVRRQRLPCRLALQTCAINWRGEVLACALDTGSRLVAGKLETSSLAELWRREHRDLRSVHAESRFQELPDPCAECRRWIASTPPAST